MGNPVLCEKDVYPSEEVIFSHLGPAADLWKIFFEEIRRDHPDFIEEWRYYNDGKSWLMKLTRKAKTVCWVTVVDGAFKITCYFPDSAERALVESGISAEMKTGFLEGKHYGKTRGLTVRVVSVDDIRNVHEMLRIRMTIK